MAMRFEINMTAKVMLGCAAETRRAEDRSSVTWQAILPLQDAIAWC